ncbi:hypothetical protein [Micromonospora rifamycinica]|uniref:Uncharacterized protein n=1 Tax=Micromonospora rifamycinica TaxID=291594 RepID=A0A1C5HUQ0_9ACTN|nr:hypothetical protein [Micromonospora rifamycinica]SCG49702.1 hypothetical protein GA0070623_1734 [Micromonospora rifamycinica]
MVSITLHRAALAVALGALVPALWHAAPTSAAAPLGAGPLPAAPVAVVPAAAPLPAAVPAVVVPAAAVPVAVVPVVAAVPGPGQPAPDDGGGEPQPPPGVVFVEVTPGTVEPGYLVGIRASCHDNSIPATVVSDAFGRVQVQPQQGLLRAAPMVRDRTRPGSYRVKLECPDGATASTALQVVKKVKPSPGPHTGFGGTAGGGLPGGLLVPGGLALTIAGAVVGIVAARRPRGVAGS